LLSLLPLLLFCCLFLSIANRCFSIRTAP
jgi:hypothetical protein